MLVGVTLPIVAALHPACLKQNENRGVGNGDYREAEVHGGWRAFFAGSVIAWNCYDIFSWVKDKLILDRQNIKRSVGILFI